MLANAKQAVIGGEPTIIIQSIDAALQVIQVTVIAMPTWLHAVIAAVIVGLSAIVNRQVVTPTASLVQSPVIATPAAPTQTPPAS